MSALHTKRHVSSAYTEAKQPAPGTVADNECDSNADTCCVGSNFIVMQYTRRTADVFPYDDSYEPITNVPIVSAATAWTDPQTMETYILIIHECLYYGTKLKHTLINPNQVRHSGLSLWDNPYDHERGLCIEGDSFSIPMHTKGTKVLFTSRAPTQDELNTCVHVELTSPVEWNPYDVSLGQVKTSKQVEPLQVHIATTYSSSAITEEKYAYFDPTSDEALLNDVNPCLVQAKELFVKEIRRQSQVSSSNIPDDVPARRSFISTERHNKVSAESLAEIWGIGIKRAYDTIDATTQRGVRSAILPLSRRYRADRMYKLKRLDAKFATDTLYGDIKSLKGNKYAQVYSHKCGFSAVYPIDAANGDKLGRSLRDFSHDFGVPEHLTMDGAMAQVGEHTLFSKTIREYEIKYHVSQPRRPNENPAEGCIRELKKRWYRIMMKRKVPRRLWDFIFVWISETGNLSVSSSHYAKGRTSLEIITGETPDISEYLDFGPYDWVTYKPNAGLGPLSLGRWLGVSHKVGQLMSYWILTSSGHVVSCVDVQRLTNAEQSTDEWRQRMKEYDESIEERLEAQNTNIDLGNYDQTPQWNRLSITDDDPEFVEEFNRVINDASVPEADSLNPKDEATDQGDSSDYINMEVGLPRGDDDNLVHAIVKRRKVDEDGEPIGAYNSNPLLDTRMYEVEFIDGTMEAISANILAENILSQVDSEGHRQMLLDEIIDHRTTGEEVKKGDEFIITRSNTKRRLMTTKGWEICVQWKDGSTDWISLKDLKNSYPIELATYAINNKISDEPAFAWWIPHTLKKRSIIISKVKSKYWQRTHKYGIKIPKNVEQAYKIDKENNNDYWRKAIEKEMKKIRDLETFRKYHQGPETLIGYQELTVHMIFDVKLSENFRRKARLVADGHKTETPSHVTYSSVVSRDSVRIMLLVAALNDLDLKAADIENAYLTAPCKEKLWIRAGKEFGSDENCIFIVAKALYGLKSSGAAFRAHLASVLDDIGFKSSIADPDVWMRPAVKAASGEEYYEYILVYVDDLLCISEDPMRPMSDISKVLRFKNDKIDDPEFYLGARLKKRKLENGKSVWTMSSVDYVNASIKTIEESIAKSRWTLPSNARTPMSSNSYLPELDDSEELDEEGITLYQELIGILRWASEISRVDILHEISLLSSYQAAPREGHLKQLLHIFAFLKKHPKLTIYFDPRLPNLDPNSFQGDNVETFREQYRDAEDELPPMMPKPRGRGVCITAFVDASHGANKVTRRSHTGFLIFLNRAPIIWYSKRQNTVESSTFSSEFIAMKACVEHITALRFKLRMFGIPIDGPADVLCDNESVVKNASKLESTLNKKHSSIAYHYVRWNVAAGITRTIWIPTDENLADPYTKRLSAEKRSYLFGNWTY